MIKRFVIISAMLAAHAFLYAQQKVFTLQSCIDSALQNNLLVNQNRFRAESNEIEYNQSKLNLLPNINGGVGHYYNQGRSIDPSTNSFVTQKFGSANYNLTGDVVLFQGLTLRNLVRQRSMDYEASKMDLQQQKDNITINLILAYLQMMNTEDMIKQLGSQAELSQKQVDRLKILNDRGSIAPAMLYDVQAQLSNDQVSLINTKNTLENQRIALCRLMNIPYEKDIVFTREAPDEVMAAYQSDTKSAYTTALTNFAKIKASDFRVQSAEEALKVAKGRLFPTLRFGSGLYSNYSSASQGAYFNQLNNNLSTSFGLTLNVPVFNSLRARNNIKQAKINLNEYALLNKTAKTELQQDIEEAYNNLASAFERYKTLREQADILKLSFGAAEAKFNVGQGTSIDYLTVKNNLDRATVNLISARYDYLLRIKIYEYYQGVSVR